MTVSRTPYAIALSALFLSACQCDAPSSSEPATLPIPSNATFVEENGIVVVEMESNILAGTDWQLKADAKASGGYAIEWAGNDNFFEAGVGELDIKVKITNPGTYRFDWATQIGEGHKTTEANDTWLKIEAERFYGQHKHSVVCPKELTPAENSCKGELPEGTGFNGWFKTYRVGGEASDYLWSAYTSDRDPHIIYADFNQPGIYSVKVSGRSKHHIIDRLILTKDFATHEAVKVYPESSRIK